ncbi:fructosamine kinase family protein [Brachybacterium muris]|uniref:Fructosamine kinase n=1 Tax=Brachybacterium muris UCD-AY4 TaxID=1249481 RepID=A0A022KTI1_9MICO|nr:fructosamine kinase [Brachybacterium muris UCD-AY4]
MMRERGQPDSFVKSRADAPAGFFETEAAGLRWLAEPGVVPVVEVLEVQENALHLERLDPAPPSAAAARAFGERLAALHDAGAPGFGWSPGQTAWFGPLDDPFEVPTHSRGSFAEFWAEDRLRRLLEASSAPLGAAGAARVGAAVDAIAAGVFDGISGEGAEQPSRVHGDLWSGNVMWTPGGAVLIDPAAHGGHRLEDLAMLSLFGAPHLEEIYAGYQQSHPLPAGWREDLCAHVLFGLLAHVHLFGSGYVAQAVSTADAVVTRARHLRG